MRSKIIYGIFSLVGLLYGPCALAQDLEVTCDKNMRCEARLGEHIFRCSIGQKGIKKDKQEGDGATPQGRFPLREVFFRADRIAPQTLKTRLPVSPLSPQDGWCDQSGHPDYNRKVDLGRLEAGVSHEELYRQDHLYDLIIVVGYNDQPVVPGRGSAIFIHIAREGFSGTAGCVGFTQQDLLTLLSLISPDTHLVIHPQKS